MRDHQCIMNANRTASTSSETQLKKANHENSPGSDSVVTKECNEKIVKTLSERPLKRYGEEL